MPRLDNSDYTVIQVYRLVFDENDPGQTPPIDLCNECACAWLDAKLFIDHPNYDDEVYHCFDCQECLEQNQDGWINS